jgi:hypothetical protein
MKRLAIALGISGALFGTACAQNYPWCLQSGAFLGSVHCSYPSLEQCVFDRQGLAGSAAKTPNTLRRNLAPLSDLATRVASHSRDAGTI